MSLTPKRESEIAERCEKAIPGPWMHDREAHHARNRLIESADVTMMDNGKIVSWLHITAWNGRDARPTADFIAHARTDLPDALSELKRVREESEALKAENKRLRGSVLNQCSDNICWIEEIDVARALPESEFLESCRRYRQQIADVGGEVQPGETKTIAQLEAAVEESKAEIGRLKEGNVALLENCADKDRALVDIAVTCGHPIENAALYDPAMFSKMVEAEIVELKRLREENELLREAIDGARTKERGEE